MKLLAAVAFLGEQKVEAVIIDGMGTLRRLRLVWRQRDPTDIPPAKFLDLLQAEVNFRQGEELKTKRGTALPTVRRPKSEK